MKMKWVSWLLLVLCLPLAAAEKLNVQEKAWLKMVDPIITGKERKTFRKKLKTHDARRQFIRLFWAKRDPDLDDNVNPFRSEYLARFDYVQTHYQLQRGAYQQFTRSSLFLLLGKPDSLKNMIDWGLLGPGFRNPFFEFPPELWIYKKPGYEYRRRDLKIQFIPSNSFGDYSAISDRITDFWLRDLKNKFIVNPDLEQAPIMNFDEEDYQLLVELAKKSEPSSRAIRSRKKKNKRKVETAAMTPEETRELGRVSDPKQAESQRVTSTEVTSTRVGYGEGPATMARVSGLQKVENLQTPAVVPAPEPSDLDETRLMVPSATTNTGSVPVGASFDPKVGNSLNILTRMSYFKSGNNRSLVLGRIGFPLKGLGFKLEDGQYKAPIQLTYSLVNSKGTSVLADRLQNSVIVPSRRIYEDTHRFYSEELVAILAGDRYTLKVQLQDLNSGTSSYHEMVLEVAEPDNENIRLSELVLIDPNANAEFARLSIKGTPYNLRLSDLYSKGERIYPVVELLNVVNLDPVAYIEIQALQGEKMIQTWDLYAEEMTDTNQRSLLLHPVLDTRLFDIGAYRLRFEIELVTGELLLSETRFVVEAE